ncbi:MAG: tyrosine--tRNA ligase [Simkaniaceae bacterium]|nr:tyrosine--tRNA ligase [Simkaniaceae bacterium]
MSNNVVDFLRRRKCLEAIAGEDLEEILQKPRAFYIGYDPTADSLHLGSFVGLVMARWMQKFGHTPVLLLGGATGRIGDPSGKDKERPLLSEAQIDANVEGIRKIFHRFFDTEGENAPIIINNLDWLGKFSLIDFLRDVGKQFRMGPMLSKESVKRRLESDEGMSFTEFTYQMMQGYDFYHLNKERNVVLQLGGSDQWGNITAGVEFTRRLTGKSVYGLTFPLIVRSDGKKFGKSEDGAIWLTEDRTSSYDLYQYLYRVPDADVITMMRLLTMMENEEIEEIEAALSSSVPNAAQKRLAEEVCRFVHGDEGLARAEKLTAAARPGAQTELNPETLAAISKEFPTAYLSIEEVVGVKYTDLCVKIGILSSKGEANRLVKNQGAYLNNDKVTDTARLIDASDLVGEQYLVFGAGKKKKMLLEVKKH